MHDWGAVQQSKVLAPGILSVSTASHGGMLVEKQLNLLIPDYMRSSDGAYEEDADWSIVATVFPHAFTKEERARAKQILRNSIPMAYELYYKEVIPPGESYVKDEMAFKILHKNDYLGLAAWGDWHSQVPPGQVVVFAGRGGRTADYKLPKDTAYFVVPADEYDEHSPYGFVIDEERHPRIDFLARHELGRHKEGPVLSIMDIVDDERSLYGKKLALFDFWLSAGDDLSHSVVEKMAFELGREMAYQIRLMGLVPKAPPKGRIGFKRSEIELFVEELLEDFEAYRKNRAKAVVEPLRQIEHRALTEGEVAWRTESEENAKRIGIERLQELIPVPPEQIRRALEENDEYLNTIPIQKWDAAAAYISYPNLTLAEKVSALKHVAKWYYA